MDGDGVAHSFEVKTDYLSDDINGDGIEDHHGQGDDGNEIIDEKEDTNGRGLLNYSGELN